MDDNVTNQNGRKKKVRVEGKGMVEKGNWLCDRLNLRCSQSMQVGMSYFMRYSQLTVIALR